MDSICVHPSINPLACCIGNKSRWDGIRMLGCSLEFLHGDTITTAITTAFDSTSLAVDGPNLGDHHGLDVSSWRRIRSLHEVADDEANYPNDDKNHGPVEGAHIQRAT